MAIGANMTKREQSLVALAVVAAALLAAYVYFIYTPKNEELGATALHVDSLEVANKQASRDVAQGSLDRLRNEANEYAGSLKVMRQLVPTGNEVPALLDDISTSARRVGLELAGVEPLPVLPGEQFDTYRYKMSVIGGFHEVGQFLSNVGSLSRIVAPVTLEMKAHNAADKTKKAKKDKSLLDTNFQVQTYVARTTPYVRSEPKR
ncbi:MAG: type 4a pilus biogenesis protein PilO [Gemmatimonadaceae bacterium]|nr:type 4a pilus biogenesis protein PilO [Gemmatimonadaceae bacterium]